MPVRLRPPTWRILRRRMSIWHSHLPSDSPVSREDGSRTRGQITSRGTRTKPTSIDVNRFARWAAAGAPVLLAVAVSGGGAAAAPSDAWAASAPPTCGSELRRGDLRLVAGEVDFAERDDDDCGEGPIEPGQMPNLL